MAISVVFSYFEIKPRCLSGGRITLKILEIVQIGLKLLKRLRLLAGSII